MNLQNDNNNTGQYPLYLGGELGLIDNVNETYPQIAKLRDELMRNQWDWREISLAKDAFDIQNPALGSATLGMTRNIEFQYATDSLVAVSIAQVMGNYCSNSELLGALQQWEFQEYVHSMQYSEIAKKAYKDPNFLLNGIKLNDLLIERLQPFVDILDECRKKSFDYALGYDNYTEEEHRLSILRFHFCLLALEGIAFAGSFAATFGVCKAAKAYDGIKNAIQLITRDELDTHVRLGVTILSILKAEWAEEYVVAATEAEELFSVVYDLEKRWSTEYLFKDISIRGLNPGLMDDYTLYLMGAICNAVGVNYNYRPVEENPLPFMDEYLNIGDIQVAAQESQLVSYNVNILDDDIDPTEIFDFDFK